MVNNNYNDDYFDAFYDAAYHDDDYGYSIHNYNNKNNSYCFPNCKNINYQIENFNKSIINFDHILLITILLLFIILYFY